MNENQGRNRPATKSERRVSAVIVCVLLVIALISSGCTAINIHEKPPANWPKLQERVVQTGFVELQGICGHGIVTTVLLGYFCSAWTVVNFDDMTCTIYTSTDDEYVMEHERAHCKGRDHFGSSALRDYAEKWHKENAK